MGSSRTGLLVCVWLATAHLASAENLWSATPEGVAKEFIAALDHLDLERIMATQAEDATMFFPHPNARYRTDGKEAIRKRMRQAFDQGRMQAKAAGRTGPPYHLGLPAPLQMKVQWVGDDAAVVTWMFDRPESFGRRSAVMKKTDGGWRMVNFHSSNLVSETN